MREDKVVEQGVNMFGNTVGAQMPLGSLGDEAHQLLRDEERNSIVGCFEKP